MLITYSTVSAVSLTVSTHRMSLPYRSSVSIPLSIAFCISIRRGTRSTVGTLKPDLAFNAHKQLISSFILGHGVYEIQCYWDCRLPCIFLRLHHIVPAVPCHWGNFEEPVKPVVPVARHTQGPNNATSRFIACRARAVMFHLLR